MPHDPGGGRVGDEFAQPAPVPGGAGPGQLVVDMPAQPVDLGQHRGCAQPLGLLRREEVQQLARQRHGQPVQEEAQRLGRIMRPKHDGGQANFYTIVTRDTVDQTFAANRQRFLAEQGYDYRIVDGLGF